jgi:hypothetical protein
MNKYSDPDPGSGIKHPGSATLLSISTIFGTNAEVLVLQLTMRNHSLKRIEFLIRKLLVGSNLHGITWSSYQQ